MKHCPITYEPIPESEKYSQRGLKLLSSQLKKLEPLPFTAAEQREEALIQAGKISIQGVQTKFSAILKVSEGKFEIVDTRGQYILKPPHEYYAEMPENEAITMSLAEIMGMAVPVHGLVYSRDEKFTYFIKRFDRYDKNKKLAVEDFAQLTKQSRDTKYLSSMEKIAKTVEQFCTFPKLEMIKLFELTLFNFLVGNEDMHLKNFSLITRDNKIQLSPAYDLLNTTIILDNAHEELALPLNGKKANLTRNDFIDYFATKHLGLNHQIISSVLEKIIVVIPKWKELIQVSFLSLEMKNKYLDLLSDRAARLKLA